MKEISGLISKGSWTGWSTPPLAVPIELRELTEIFTKLQEARHMADYDNTKIWTSTEVDARLNEARTAFQNWQKIQNNPTINEYLLALLIGKKRE